MHTRRGKWNLGEEERCPKTSPQTLFRITKPPTNKGKEKMIEVKEEEERIVEIPKQALVLSIDRRREPSHGSASPDWNMSPNAKTCDNEQAEGLEQQGSNAVLMEMLSIMEQNMKERDNQLRKELKERNLYLDKELRKKYQFFDEVIR